MQVRAKPATVGQDDLLEPVLRRMRSLSGLADDWDSYGGVPPTAIALEQALGFCRRVAELLGPSVGERVRPVEISPLANGGIQLDWQGADFLIAVDVGPEGSWGYLTKVGNGRAARYEEYEGLTDEELAEITDVIIWPISAPASA